MSLKLDTPCDHDGSIYSFDCEYWCGCPYGSIYSFDCEYWCGADEPEDLPSEDYFEGDED